MLTRLFGFFDTTPNSTAASDAGWRHASDDDIVNQEDQRFSTPSAGAAPDENRGDSRSASAAANGDYAVQSSIVPRCVLYRREVSLAAGAEPLRITLSSILDEANIVDAPDERLSIPRRDQPRLIDGGNRALIVEVVLVLLSTSATTTTAAAAAGGDGSAAAMATYTTSFSSSAASADGGGVAAIVASLVDIAPHQSTDVRCRLPSADEVARSPCGGEHGVDHWCAQCVARPNLIALYHTALSDAEIVRFGEELCHAKGTSHHLMRPNCASADAEGVDMELGYCSTIARELYYSNMATDDARGTLFVSRSDWCAALARSRTGILDNLPLANLSRAAISLQLQNVAKGTTVSAVLGVSCFEFFDGENRF
jgi:hypothetical protein